MVTKGGSLNLQLSELVGHNNIDAQNLADEAIIYISQTIEQDLNIDVGASKVSLDAELEHLAHALNEDKSRFLLSNENKHHLMVSSTGQNGVRLGKQSWSDMMRQKLQAIATEPPPSPSN